MYGKLELISAPMYFMRNHLKNLYYNYIPSNPVISIFIRAVNNSYLGILKQFSTYRLRKKMLSQNLSAYFWNEFFISNGYGKVARRRKTR